MFKLNQQLSDDTVEVIALQMCRVLLMKDRRFPWLVLVPEIDNAVEIIDLKKAERGMLMEDIATAAKALKAVYKPDKINIGSLGNIVTQLHVHVIGRYKNDGAWPGPVWGSGKPIPYSATELDSLCEKLREGFNGIKKRKTKSTEDIAEPHSGDNTDGLATDKVEGADVNNNNNPGGSSPGENGNKP